MDPTLSGTSFFRTRTIPNPGLIRAPIPPVSGTRGNNSGKHGNNSCISGHFNVGKPAVIFSSIWAAKNDGDQVFPSPRTFSRTKGPP
jgi:hypothetical protein